MRYRKKSTVDITNELQELNNLVTVESTVHDSIPPIIYPEKKKPRKKIKRKGDQPTLVNYFTDKTQEQIIIYQQEADTEKKKKIYVKEILPAFDSLVENLINVYGFSVMYESKQDLKHECLQFLYTAVDKFNAEKGSKAFSYFNVVAKNWLTIKSKQNMKRVQSYVSIDDRDNLSKEDIDQIETHHFYPGFEDILTTVNPHEYLTKLVGAIEDKTKTENEKIVVNAIKVLINNLEDVDLLSKRAILLYVRELTTLSSKQLSIVLSSLKRHYRDVKNSDDFIP
jgi:hypothetical protein